LSVLFVVLVQAILSKSSRLAILSVSESGKEHLKHTGNNLEVISNAVLRAGIMLSFIICLVHLDDTWCIPGRAIDVHRIPSAKNVSTVFNITEGSSRFTHEFPYRHIGLTNSIFAVNTSASLSTRLCNMG
jgi:hypothetical protein